MHTQSIAVVIEATCWFSGTHFPCQLQVSLLSCPIYQTNQVWPKVGHGLDKYVCLVSLECLRGDISNYPGVRCWVPEEAQVQRVERYMRDRPEFYINLQIGPTWDIPHFQRLSSLGWGSSQWLPLFSNSYSRFGWAPKNWCFWTVVLEKTLESPLDCKEIKPVNSKGDQSWIFIGRTDAEAEAPILWLPDVKSQLIRKDPDAGKDWGQEGKGVTEDEMIG